MPYVPQTWNDDDPSTPISAVRLNHMEAGILSASQTANLSIITMMRPGGVTIGAGVAAIALPRDFNVVGVRANTSSNVTITTKIDVNVNGSSIFITQANRPVILSGTQLMTTDAVPDTLGLSAGSLLTVDVDEGDGINNLFVLIMGTWS